MAKSDGEDKEAKKPSSGLRLPPAPPDDITDPYGIAMHYLTYYEAEYARARSVVKRRARTVVLGIAAANSLIAVAGVAVAVTRYRWLGLLSAGLAGVIAVLGAWEGLFRHRDLWIQRSQVLSQLQELQRNTRMRKSVGDDLTDVGTESLKAMNNLLEESLVTWANIRRMQSHEERGANTGLPNP